MRSKCTIYGIANILHYLKDYIDYSLDKRFMEKYAIHINTAGAQNISYLGLCSKDFCPRIYA